MIKLGIDRFISLKEFTGTRKVFDNSTRQYQQQYNVGRLHELQRRELRERHFAVRHDSRWQHRKLVVYSCNGMCNYKKSPGSRKSAIRHGQSDSELASAGESGQTLTSIILSSLSCALSSKSGKENDKEESYQSQASNLAVSISGKSEQSLSTSTDVLGRRVNILSEYNPLTPDIQESNANSSYPVKVARSKYVQKLPEEEIGEVATDVLQPKDSDGITYILAKETNQTRDGIRHGFLNASRISEGFATLGSTERKRKNEEGGKTENKLAQEKESLAKPPNDTDINNISKLSSNATDNTLQKRKFLQEQNSSFQVNKNSNSADTFPATKHLAENSSESSVRLTNVIADSKVEDQTLKSRTDQENWESREDYLMEAASFGLQAMHNLYYIQEPKLYSMGLYLGSDNPARYVAAFNDQSEEARDLARFGYAALQSTTMFLKRFPDAPLELSLSRSKFTRRTLLEQQCPRRDPPRCPPASLRYRTSDGSCNNLQNLWWGSAMSAMQRFLPPEYHDGVQSIRKTKNERPLPSAREITNEIHEEKDVPLASITHMLMQWGQFVDHDLAATGQSRGFNGTVPQCCLRGGVGFQSPELMHPECLPIAVNLRDSFYGPLGVRCLEFLRSGPAPKEGCEFGPREQLSQVTSYLDASMVYSSNAMQSDSLRIFRNGLLQYGRIQSRKPLLPKRESDLCKRGSLSTTCFRAGDGRLSEQPALTSLHIVFLRLHNRIATELSALNSHWSDEKLFQETRRIVGAVVQHITYREFLPIILGPQVMKIFDLEVLKKGYYEGYDPTVNPTIANSFATAAYRFGHSLVQRSFIRFDSNHQPILNNVSIHDEFSNPANLEASGSVDRLVLGLVNQPCQRRDVFISEEMTNHLFQTPAFAFGMDLASLNIQRGRDHGLPPYVRWREPCSLSPIRTFEDLDKVMSPNTVRKFRSLYASVDDIDLYTAGLAEKSVVGGLIGPTFACIIGQQFSNLRRGDRFWYENPESESSFNAGQLQQIRRVTLAQVLCRTMDSIETIQPFVFLAADALKNQRLSCDDPTIGQLNLEFWAERPSEFRSNDNDDDPQKTKRTTIDINTPESRVKGENANSQRKHNEEQAKITSQKPFKTGVNQNNKIVVKRPFGRPDNGNITIMVQNHAVNSPVFVNEGIYGSHIRIQEQPTVKPTSNQASNHPAHRPPGKPIPIVIPHLANFHSTDHSPYVPYAFNDPSNPNPLAYGYRSPAAAAPQDDVFYDNYPPTSPRPTLYTYYTSFQQKPTRIPDHKIDGYLINYGPGYHEHGSLPAHTHERPKPPVHSGPHYDSNSEQKPNYSSFKPPANTRPISVQNYASHDESHHTHKPSYGVQKPPTTTRPNLRPNYESNNGLYQGQKPDYNRPKPPANLRPNDESHQKPVYSGFISLAISRPDSRPDLLYGTQKPGGAGNPHFQSDDLNNRPSEGYPGNLNKPQGQWSSNGYSKRPGDKLYDDDDPDAYRKRPSVKPPSYSTESFSVSSNKPSEYNSQFWKEASPATIKDSAQDRLYGSVPTFSGTNTPSYQKGTLFPANHDNYNRYSDATSIHQKIASSTPSSRPNTASYVKESGTRLPQSDIFTLYSSSSSQKPTSDPSYQKDDQSQLPFYLKESVDRPHSTTGFLYDETYKNPTKPPYLKDQFASSTPLRPETSTIGFQVHKQEENLSSRPTKIHSVTIVTETIETIHHPGQSGYIPQHRVTSEIPRPLAQQIKSNVPIAKKPGQYYYEKNVLHRYPGEVVDQIPKSNHYSTDKPNGTLVQDQTTASEIAAETSITDDSVTSSGVIQGDENKLTTTPTLVIANDNKRGDVTEDLARTFSADVENVALADVPIRINYWMNPQEDLNLPSMLEMPEILSDEFTNDKELPKPIKSSSHAT
ncbi:uncharacterized protein [Linepithema humile]|uniref:uncharacterized protein n=1 Tax=Linepithema humile TaxID=83485 RepID=UPI00351EDACA